MIFPHQKRSFSFLFKRKVKISLIEYDAQLQEIS